MLNVECWMIKFIQIIQNPSSKIRVRLKVGTKERGHLARIDWDRGHLARIVFPTRRSRLTHHPLSIARPKFPHNGIDSPTEKSTLSA